MSNDRSQAYRSSPQASSPLLLFGLFALWAILVGIGVYNHVFWRDEMRALSLVREAPNLFAIPATAQGEGHPSLWYIVLGVAYATFRSTLVLPGVTVALAAVGVGLFLWKSPFALWWKAVFVLSGLAIYEYSVMARDYALIMPLFFGLTIAVVAKRRRYWLIAVLLFLLMQADVYATLLAPFFVLVLLRDWRRADRGARLGMTICAAAALLGLLASVASLYPVKHDLVTQSFSNKLPLAAAALRITADPGLEYMPLFIGPEHIETHSVFLLHPEYFATPVVMMFSVVLYGVCAGLLPDLVLFACAILGLWITAAVPVLIYPMTYRHSGVWLVFLICLYWIWIRDGRTTSPRLVISPRLRTISWGMLTAVLVLGVSFSIATLYRYTQDPSSDSRALARLITTNPALRRAIVMPDPGEMTEGLPYYVDNPIYMAREHTYRRLAYWTRSMVLHMPLTQLLDDAQQLHRTTGRPVIMVMANIPPPGDRTLCIGLGRTLTYTAAERTAFADAVQLLPLGPAIDESYIAFLLRDGPQAGAAAFGAPAVVREQARYDNWTQGGGGAAGLQRGSDAGAHGGGDTARCR